MADVMVTARMTQAKKREGNHVLEELGLTASQAINQLYDYLISQRQTPFERERETEPGATRAALEQALEFVQEIPRTSRLSVMTDDEIKRERLVAKGLLPLTSEDGE